MKQANTAWRLQILDDLGQSHGGHRSYELMNYMSLGGKLNSIDLRDTDNLVMESRSSGKMLVQ